MSGWVGQVLLEFWHGVVLLSGEFVRRHANQRADFIAKDHIDRQATGIETGGVTSGKVAVYSPARTAPFVRTFRSGQRHFYRIPV